MIETFIWPRSTQHRRYPWLLREKKRPRELFPGRLQKLIAQTQQDGFVCPSYFSALMSLCPPVKTTWSRVQLLFPWHSSSPGPVLGLPACHIHTGHHRPATLAFASYLRIYNWVVHVGCLTISLSPFLFQPHWRDLMMPLWPGLNKQVPIAVRKEVPSPLKPLPWSCIAATCPVLLLKFTRWLSRPSLLTMQTAN